MKHSIHVMVFAANQHAKALNHNFPKIFTHAIIRSCSFLFSPALKKLIFHENAFQKLWE